MLQQLDTWKEDPFLKGDILDLNGATVIAAGQFKGNMTLRNIVIPEGVTEIGEYAFYSCMFLETVVFHKSLRKIGEMAFMSCRNLRQVELPEGVEELETHVFGATNNLTEVHLPDSLKKVNRFVFGLGGDSPYATAYLSGKLAKQLYDINGDEFDDIYARHIIIEESHMITSRHICIQLVYMQKVTMLHTILKQQHARLKSKQRKLKKKKNSIVLIWKQLAERVKHFRK